MSQTGREEVERKRPAAKAKSLRIQGAFLTALYTVGRMFWLKLKTEQVRRIVLVVHSHKPLVIRPVGGLDALRSLVGLQADLVDVVAASGEGAHNLRQLARQPDVYVVCRRVYPTRQAAPLAQGTPMAECCCCSVYPVRGIAQLLKEDKRKRRWDGSQSAR